MLRSNIVVKTRCLNCVLAGLHMSLDIILPPGCILTTLNCADMLLHSFGIMSFYVLLQIPRGTAPCINAVEHVHSVEGRKKGRTDSRLRQTPQMLYASISCEGAGDFVSSGKARSSGLVTMFETQLCASGCVPEFDSVNSSGVHDEG